MKQMDKYLTRDDDRALFGLPKLAGKETPKENNNEMSATEVAPKIDLSRLGTG